MPEWNNAENAVLATSHAFAITACCNYINVMDERVLTHEHLHPILLTRRAVAQQRQQSAARQAIGHIAHTVNIHVWDGALAHAIGRRRRAALV